jgi:SAM-dependent methyltransferase
VDFSAPLLEESAGKAFHFPVEFFECDLVHLKLPSHSPRTMAEAAPASRGLPPALASPALGPERWSMITAFAVLHHIPSSELRVELLSHVHERLQPDGKLIMSNWQFLHSPRLRARVQPWEAIGLTTDDVDTNDCLLDWRSGGKGLRYVHHFDEAELAGLAAASGFEVRESFYSDGADRKTGLYQLWRKAGRLER